MPDDFDLDATFDDDYWYFYPEVFDAARAAQDTDIVWRLTRMEQGQAVLDLACGHGRLSNRLAAKGAQVVGLDITHSFLERARQDALEMGVTVEYVLDDMRSMHYDSSFHVVINWFSSFGYFDDETNRSILQTVRRSLRQGGRLIIDVLHAPAAQRRFQHASVRRVGDDAMIDEMTYDAETGRVRTQRTIIRNGKARSFRFSLRWFAFPELRDWLLAAGFSNVQGFGSDGEPLTAVSARMIVVGTATA